MAECAPACFGQRCHSSQASSDIRRVCITWRAMHDGGHRCTDDRPVHVPSGNSRRKFRQDVGPKTGVQRPPKMPAPHPRRYLRAPPQSADFYALQSNALGAAWPHAEAGVTSTQAAWRPPVTMQRSRKPHRLRAHAEYWGPTRQGPPMPSIGSDGTKGPKCEGGVHKAGSGRRIGAAGTVRRDGAG